MKLYACVLIASNYRGQTIAPASLIAQNEEEAIGEAYNACHEHFPDEQLWRGHMVGVHENERDMIDKVIAEIATPHVAGGEEER